MSKNDGGSAFPGERIGHYEYSRVETGIGTCQVGSGKPVMVQEAGMSLRDYFAAHAMSALLSELYVQSIRHKMLFEVSIFDIASKAAYEVADAMLKEREK